MQGFFHFGDSGHLLLTTRIPHSRECWAEWDEWTFGAWKVIARRRHDNWWRRHPYLPVAVMSDVTFNMWSGTTSWRLNNLRKSFINKLLNIAAIWLRRSDCVHKPPTIPRNLLSAYSAFSCILSMMIYFKNVARNSTTNVWLLADCCCVLANIAVTIMPSSCNRPNSN